MSGSKVGFSRFRLAVKAGLKLVLAPFGVVLRASHPGLRVLFYHRVNDHAFDKLGLVSREITVRSAAFDQQLAYLKRKGYRTISLADAEAMLAGEVPLDSKAILITFDDGYLDNLEVAAPLLEKHGFSAAVFAVNDRIGRSNDAWPMSDPSPLGRFMDRDQLRAWCTAGNEVGSHTLSHPNLSSVSDSALQQELEASKVELGEMLGIKCSALAYPGGDVDDRVAEAAATTGYRLAFTTKSGCNSAKTSKMLLRRTEVSASDPFLVFRFKMAGFLDWLAFRDTPAYRNVLRSINGRLARRSPKPGPGLA